MREDLSAPWRPQRLSPVHAGRLLKRWRYVGIFSEELMACAAHVRIGPAAQSFWALQLRGEPLLRERTHTLRGRGAVQLSDGALRVHDAGVSLELRLSEAAPIQARCTHQGRKVWTRKQAGVGAQGTLRLDGGEPREIRALAVIDDTAGYHAHRTEWWWSAGVGTGAGGEALAWNLVSGVNDPERGSERAIWVDGAPYECAPVSFSADLSQITGEDGAQLRFAAEAERARSENLVLIGASTGRRSAPSWERCRGPAARAHRGRSRSRAASAWLSTTWRVGN